MQGWPPWRRWRRVGGAQRRCHGARACAVRPVGAGLDLGAAKLAALAEEVADLAAAVVAAGPAAVGAAVREAVAGDSRIDVEAPGPQRCER